VARLSLSRLPPAEWFPAGWPGITARMVPLADGTSLRVVEAGPADGEPVVMIHGWAVSAYLWRHTMVGLAAAGYRTYAPDLPGHGLSDSPGGRGEYTLDAFTRRGEQLLDALGLDRPSILAQSMGGRIAAALAIRGRAKRLALFGPVGFGAVTPATAYAPFLSDFAAGIATTLVTRQMVEIVQRRVHGKLGWFTDRDVDEYWAPTQFPAVVRAQLQMLREFTWTPLTVAELQSVTVDTLVVFGSQDRTVKPTVAAELAAHLSKGRLEWVEGGGHVLMEEIPAQVNAMLVEFLRREG
jgi:pimeloyl-ACP methyl ester carboxylesterase